MRQACWFSLIAIFFLCLAGYSPAVAAPKFGIVDMEKFQERSKSFQKVRAKLKKKFDTLQKKLDQEKNELLKVEEEFKKQSMMLSLDAKEDKKRELEKKRRHYKFMAEEYTREMEDSKRDATRRIGEEMEKIVGEIGKKQKYTIILEKRTLGLLYYDKRIDITDQVVKAYDRRKK